MKYQKLINWLDNTKSQPSKFRARNWVEINDESRGAYNINENNNSIKFKISMIRSNLSDYGEAYIPVKENIVVSNSAAQGATVNNTNKKVTFKNCALFTSCTTKINNTQVDDAQDIDIVIPMYNLIEYSNTY